MAVVSQLLTEQGSVSPVLPSSGPMAVVSQLLAQQESVSTAGIIVGDEQLSKNC